MLLKINGTDYSFKFGVKFIRELDKRMPLEQEGVKFGLGLQAKVIPELQSGNIATLSDVLYIANQTEENKVEQDMLDDYIDDSKDVEKIFDDVMKELSESNAGKSAMKNFQTKLNAQK